MKQRVKLTENMLREMVRNTISEELMRIDEAKHNYGKYIRRKIYDYLAEKGKIETIENIEKRSDEEVNNIIADIPQVRDAVDTLRGGLLHDYSSYKDPIKRIVPTFVKIALENGVLENEFYRNSEVINNLKSILDYISDNYNNNFKIHTVDAEGNNVEKTLADIPSDITYEELKNMFHEAFNEDGTAKTNKTKVDKIDYSNHAGYNIEANITFERAHEVGKFSGGHGAVPLCYTTKIDTWNNFTNNGQNTVYLLLKNGWEQWNDNENGVPMPPPLDEIGDDAPYDEYGESMIFLFVDSNDNLKWSNVRWNHKFENRCPDGHKTDVNFTKEEITKLTGLSFDNHFISVENNENGNYLKKIENILTGKEEQDEENPVRWFERPLTLDKNCVRITAGKTEQVNFLDKKNNKFLFYKWFDRSSYIEQIDDKIYCDVTYDRRKNIITSDYKLLFGGPTNEWPEEVDLFCGGFARFKLNNKWNYINTDGEILYEPNNPDKWFDNASDMEIGKAWVLKNGKYNIINKHGKLSYAPSNHEEWFDNIVKRVYTGDYVVEKNGIYEVVSFDGELVPIAQAIKHYLKTNRRINGGLLDGVYKTEKDKMYEIHLGSKCNLLKADGTLLSPCLWFDSYFCPSDDTSDIFIKLNYKFTLMNENGKILYEPGHPEKWFDDCRSFENGFSAVKFNGKYNYIDIKGKLLSPNLWFDDVSDYFNDDGYATVIIDDEEGYVIDKNGNFYDYETRQPVPPPTGGNVTNESILRLKNKIRHFVNEAIRRYTNKADL